MYEIILTVVVTALIVAIASSKISTMLEHDTAYKEGYREGLSEGIESSTNCYAPINLASDDRSWQYHYNPRVHQIFFRSWVSLCGYNMTYEGLKYQTQFNYGDGPKAYIDYQSDNGLETITINEDNVGRLIRVKNFTITVLLATPNYIIFEDVTP
jgi:hypothetical protein